MSLSQRILQIWNTSQFKAPNVPLIYHDNQYMATVDDSTNFFRFMSADGQIFVALSTRCQIQGPGIYVCTKIDPILCSPVPGLQYGRDIFVLNNIAPLIA
jgi:hypothetical protein